MCKGVRTLVRACQPCVGFHNPSLSLPQLPQAKGSLYIMSKTLQGHPCNNNNAFSTRLHTCKSVGASSSRWKVYGIQTTLYVQYPHLQTRSIIIPHQYPRGMSRASRHNVKVLHTLSSTLITPLSLMKTMLNIIYIAEMYFSHEMHQTTPLNGCTLCVDQRFSAIDNF